MGQVRDRFVTAAPRPRTPPSGPDRVIPIPIHQMPGLNMIRVASRCLRGSGATAAKQEGRRAESRFPPKQASSIVDLTVA